MMATIVLTASLLVSQAAVDFYCHEYAIDYRYGAEIARLESNWDAAAVGDAHMPEPSVGLFQFQPDTWRWARQKMGLDASLALRLSAWESARTWGWCCQQGYWHWWSTHEAAKETANVPLSSP